MIKPGSIKVFDSSIATNDSFYNGTFNFKQLDIDPLLTGYAVIIWDKVPSWVEAEYKGFRAMTQKNFLGLTGIEDMQIETEEYNYGFNNNAYNFVKGITKNNTEFTLRHQEYSGSPIKNMYQHWVTNIMDPETGISPYGKKYGLEYSAKNHTGSLLYIVLRPDVNNTENNNIEFACYWTNVFPKKLPLGHFEYSQGTRDKVEIEMPFSGTMHISAAVDNYAKTKLKESYSYVTAGMFDPTSLTQGAKDLAAADATANDKENSENTGDKK